LLRSRGQGNRHSRNAIDHDGSKGNTWWSRKIRTLSLLSILQQLNEPDGYRKLGRVEKVGGRLIRQSPYTFQGFYGKFRPSKELDGFCTSNATGSLRVGGRKQAGIILLSF